MKRFLVQLGLSAIFLLPMIVKAQQEVGLHFMPRAWQSQQTNPAIFNEKVVVFTLPAAHMQAGNTGFSFNDVVKEDPSSDSLIIDLDGVIGGLDAENFLHFQTNVDLLNLGIRLKDLQLGASVGVRGRGYLYYPKSLVELAWEGNASRVGETVSLAPDFQAFGYAEIGLSGAYRIKDKIQFGAKIKYLSGLADVSAGTHIAHLTTQAEYYQLSMVSDYQVNTSVISFDDSTGGEGFEFALGHNTGYAADLGVVVHLNDKIQFSASAIDIGYIDWDEKVRNYEVKGSYEFEGVDVAEMVRDDSFEIESVLDTLGDIFEVVETTNGYRTKLPMKVYVSATFSPIKSLRLSGAYFNESYRGKSRTAYSVSASKDLGKIFTGGITYSIRNKQFDDLGVNMLLKLGPYVMFVVTDNVIDLISPRQARDMHFRWGTNFTF